MGFLNNLKLRTKFAVMLLLPLAGLIWFGGAGLWDKRVVSQQMGDLSHLAELAVKVSALVHEAQKERGMTAGFLGSKGAEFRSQLSSQRDKVDLRAQALRQFIGSLDITVFGEEFDSALGKAMTKLSSLADIRRKVDGLNISAGKAISFITQMNAAFLGLVGEIVKKSTDARITSLAASYVNFLQGKERAGIERAVLSNTFASDQFAPGAYVRFNALVAAQKAYFNSFEMFAPPDVIAFYRKKMSSPAVAEVQKMRQIAVKKGEVGEKAGLLADLFQDIGYGGAIHLFKNCVLRGQEKYAKTLDKKFQNIMNIISRYRGLHNVSDRERADLAVIKETMSRYRDAVHTALKMSRAGKTPTEIDAVVKINDGPALKALKNLARTSHAGNFGIDAAHWFQTISAKIDLLKEVENHIAANLYGRTQALRKSAENAFWITLAATLAVVIFAIGLALVIMTRILAQVGGEPDEVMNVAEKVAQGDLTVRLDPSRREDSIYGALRNMVANLSSTVAQVNQAAITVAVTAGEISNGNQELSNRTQQQAAAIEETASALEQMTGSVKHNASNSEEANDLARRTASMAQQGGEVVARTEKAMAAVTESSKKISDIINVVNEIAFQTNLLALNAAVEAARAGEAGRGFAVVAGEVRNLAGRSASAAKEIQGLITDSVKKVEQGNESVSESGRLLGEIIVNVQAVADTIGEISAASQEQAQGIEEVNKAVSQMDQAVQQNAAQVEEAASASETMASAARDLRARMNQFKLKSRDNAPQSGSGPETSPPPKAAPKPEPKPKAAAPAPAAAPAQPAAAAKSGGDDFFDLGELDGFEEF